MGHLNIDKSFLVEICLQKKIHAALMIFLSLNAGMSPMGTEIKLNQFSVSPTIGLPNFRFLV